MSATDSRCIVCNGESMGNQFCSQQCEDEFKELIPEPQPMSDEEWESLIESEPPYLDDYYKPYIDTISDAELDELRRSK